MVDAESGRHVGCDGDIRTAFGAARHRDAGEARLRQGRRDDTAVSTPREQHRRFPAGLELPCDPRTHARRGRVAEQFGVRANLGRLDRFIDERPE